MKIDSAPLSQRWIQQVLSACSKTWAKGQNQSVLARGQGKVRDRPLLELMHHLLVTVNEAAIAGGGSS